MGVDYWQYNIEQEIQKSKWEKENGKQNRATRQNCITLTKREQKQPI